MIRKLFVGALLLALCAAPPVQAQHLPSGTLVYQANNYAHISTNATTTVKSAQGLLAKICVNTKGASSNTATVYDNTAASGTVIAVVDTTATTGCYEFNVQFSTGLTIVTATGTAGDITVAWR